MVKDYAVYSFRNGYITKDRAVAQKNVRERKKAGTYPHCEDDLGRM